ncbi:MAG: glycoside hydrolase family 2 protein [Candidatus Limimorpha sp.]
MKHIQRILTIALALLLFSCANYSNTADQSLNEGWNLQTDTLNIDLQVNVPSVAQSDLFEAGIIPNPYLGKVEQDLQWIPQHHWDYSLTFNVEDAVFEKDNIELVFNGLDTYADVFLNGEKIIHSDNMFLQYSKDVKKLLRKENNELKVHFYPFDIVRDSLIETYRLRFPEKYAVMRKCGYQNGWDWAPRYLNIGICKDVTLHAWSGYDVTSASILTENVADNRAEMRLRLNIKSQNERNIEVSVQFDKEKITVAETLIKKGDNEIVASFNIENPKLWWPNEMGEQTMTTFKVNVEDTNDGTSAAPVTVTTGIRKVELVQEPDSIGKSMFFRINGKDVFAKGANYIPEEMIETWMSKEKTIKLLKECKDYHFNMLRVWGGGIYPPGFFFDACDSLGIMVWEDFMYAGSTYPYSDEFLNNAKEEAIQQVIHYQNHPSLVMWCGNNEVSNGFYDWGWKSSMKWSDADYLEMQHGMDTLFKDILNEVVSHYDGTIPYFPSSPTYGWGHEESLTEGDSHYWGVWWGEYPYEVYLEKVARFNSEYGYQAYPSLSTLKKISPELDWNVIDAHQKHARGKHLINSHINKYIDDNNNDDIAQLVYNSQLSQAWGMGLAIEAHRAAKPRSMGTLYWQLNDAWPVISWSSIDYYGNKKALHWKLKELFAPILIGVLPTKDGNFTVYANSDLYREINAQLLINVKDFSGNILKTYSENVVIPENGCTHLSLDFNDFVRELDKNSLFIDMQLIENNNVISERLQYLAYPKDLKLQKTDISPKVNINNDIVTLEFFSNTLVKDVYVESSDNNGVFSDNFFDVKPNEQKVITFKTTEKNPTFNIMILNQIRQH